MIRRIGRGGRGGRSGGRGNSVAALAALALATLVPGAGPAAAQAPPPGLTGKLEEPQIVRDPVQWPRTFNEAPMLATRVRAGELPPVAQRVPEEPLVLRPLRGVGRYGGTWRRAFLGPNDGENGNRLRAADKPLFFDMTANAVVPNVARDWQVSPDGRRTTLFLRRGMRWSDGTPFTADDFVFWFEDIYGNKELVPAPAPEMLVDGTPGRVTKLDDATVAFDFDAPYFLFPAQLAGDTFVGGGPSRHQSEGRAYGLYAPAHYLRQFLPKYTPVDVLTQRAKAAGYDNWVQWFRYKTDWRLNPDMPTVAAFRTVQPITAQIWLLERNPYFYEVDTEGNQLPYIDRVQMTLAENLEVVNLRAVAGEYDYQERFIDLAKLPVFLENATRGRYKVHLDRSYNGSDSTLVFQLSYREDPEVAKWISNPEFRRALSLGIDREQLNEAFWLGLGTPGSVVPAADVPESPGDAYRDRWSTHDPARANAMLDRIGLAKRDREGYRVRTDNGERLRLRIDVALTLSPTWAQQAEMVVQQWRAIGIAAEMKVYERGLFVVRMRNEQVQLSMSSNTGTENLFIYPVGALPVRADTAWMGAGYSLWFQSGGTAGIKPAEPELLRAMDLLRAGSSLRDEERARTAQEIWKLAVEQQWAIGLVGQSPAYMGIRVVSERLQNVPERTCISQQCRTPWGARPEQWWFR